MTTTFNDLGLNDELLKALATEGYTKPTPIQARAIPDLIAGRDLLGIAQTGTGKTAAFALPIMHRLAASARPTPRRGARALVLSPTRELATQIAESFKTYGRHTGFSVATVFGGVAHRPQALALQRGLDVLVATPGRLIDHIQERNIDLSQTEILVLDEADQMMDLGFIRPLRQIIAKLSMKRQSMFFSATMPHEIGALAAELLRDPVEVSVTPVAKTADRVAQKVILVEQSKKKSMLVELFGDAGMTRTLVFTRTKRGADKVARHLETHGIAVAAIHGNKSQNQREAALAAFKAGKIRGLIATDIAARGIDVDEVSHVVNFEIPNIPESYVHRIGRTARAGAEGIAISLVDHEERAYLRDIEKLTRQQIPSEDRRNDASLAVEERVRHTRSEGQNGESSGRADRHRGSKPRGEHGARGQRSDGQRSRGGEGRGDRKFGGSRTDAGSQRREFERADRNRDEHAGGDRPQRAEGSAVHPRSEFRKPASRQDGDRNGGRRAEHRSGGKRFESRDRAEHGNGHRPNSERRDHGPRHGAGEYVHEVPFGAMPERPDGARKREFENGERHRGNRQEPRSHQGRGGEHGHHARPHHGGGNRNGSGQGRDEGRRHDGQAHQSRDGNRPRSGDAHASAGRRDHGADQRRASGGQRPQGGQRSRGDGNGWGRRPH